MLKDESKILKSALGSLETSLKSLLNTNNDQEQYWQRESLKINILRRPWTCWGINQAPCQRAGKSFACWGYWQWYFCKSLSPPSKVYKSKKPAGPLPIITKINLWDTTWKRHSIKPGWNSKANYNDLAVSWFLKQIHLWKFYNF